jgi:hypothetical protein
MPENIPFSSHLQSVFTISPSPQPLFAGLRRFLHAQSQAILFSSTALMIVSFLHKLHKPQNQIGLSINRYFSGGLVMEMDFPIKHLISRMSLMEQGEECQWAQKTI